jgi:adenosylcobinamide-GDP ribazoletransferase
VVKNLNSFFVALSFLTRIPVPGEGGNFTTNSLSRSTIFFPVVGAIIGAVNAGLYIILNPFLPTSVLAVIIVALPIFITGGIHFDGLLDTCDGLFSGRSRERSLEIMRDSRVGSMGVIAGIFNVMLRYSILIELPGAVLPFILVTQAVTGRWVMSMALHFFPYARKDGGLGQGFTEGKKIIYISLSSGFALLITMLINGAAGVFIVLIVTGLSLLIACWVMRKIGGLTGDVYGALNEVAENIFLLLWLVGSSMFYLHSN